MSKTLVFNSELSSQNKVLEDAKVLKVDDLLEPHEIPSWLTDQYMEKVLQKSRQDPALKVKRIVVQQCGGKGDSYASTMYRVATFYNCIDHPETTHFGSYIIKTLPTHEMAKEKLGTGHYNVQQKEMEMYQQILPEYERILTSIAEDGNIFPKAISIDHVHEVIVLEDLMEKKFIMNDRTKGLDLKHSQIALKKLASMHACSIMMLEKNPKVFENFDTGMFNRKTSAFHIFFQSNLEAVVNEVEQWPGQEYYARKLRNLLKTMLDNAITTFDCDDGDLHVLTHGDLWINNMMFKYDAEGNIIDIVVLDFQYCCLASPTLDLIYFILTSTKNELRFDQFDELVQFYYYQLRDLLLKMNFDMSKLPSLHKFHLQMEKKLFYGFTTLFLVFPVMISKDKDADFEALMSSDSRATQFKKRLVQNPYYQEVIKRALPLMDRKGLLDPM
ncbi:unnamed protein product [Diamesa tonsa]